MSRVAVLSLHTSPLVLPGRGDAGGMNVYVRELASSMAQAGIDATVFVRRHNDAAAVVDVEPGFRVVHIDAGPPELPKESLAGSVDRFAEGVARWLRDSPVDVLHANYWLSGVAGHRLKHELDLPLVSTFHTLARVKATTGDPEPQRRIEAEAEVIACSDVITANSVAEVQQLAGLYGADPQRIDVVAPGVDSAFFSAGSRRGARAALGLGDEPVLLFVGRIQPLKGLSVATETLVRLGDDHRDARLLVVGGASGPDGERELRRLEDAVRLHRLQGRVSVVAPQPHHLLSTYYRAADVCLVPSRSESFGLVALEASACGLPVVAADVGGLRTLVDHGRNGFRITERDPALYVAAVRSILDDASLARSMARHGAEMAARYSWTATAGRLRRIFEDLSARGPGGLHALRGMSVQDSPASGGDPLTGAAPVTDAELDATEHLVDSWLEAAAASNPAIAAVERGPAGSRRWYVRVCGDEKEVWTIWFTLGQRTFHYETYLVPAPEENHAQFYEHLLRRNRRLTGLKLEIGPEDAVFLSGSTPVGQLSAGALDGILGSMYAATELIFRPAMRIGYASKFRA